MKNRKNIVFRSAKVLALSAMLTAMSVVIGIVCKNFFNFGNGLLRITLENLPIILSGILFGPVIGGFVGAASDLVSYLFSTQALPPNLIVTAGATAVGVVSGVCSQFIVKERGTKQVIVSAGLAHIVGSMIIKPIGLYQFYSYAVLVRIPLYLIIAPFEILVLCILFNNKSFQRIVDF